MGVYPSLFLDPMHASVNQLLAQIGDRGRRSRPALSAETRAREPRPDPRRLRADPVPAARWRLLLLGAFRGEQDGARLLTPLAVLAMLVAALIAAGARQDPRAGLRRPVRLDGFAVFLKVLILLGAAGALLLAGRLHARREHRALRVPAAGAVLGPRHVHDGLGQQPARPLHGARAAEPAALRAGRVPSRQPALDRGRAEIFRPGRAGLGHAALRLLAGLRLHRHALVRRAGAGSAPASRRSALCRWAP